MCKRLVFLDQCMVCRHMLIWELNSRNTLGEEWRLTTVGAESTVGKYLAAGAKYRGLIIHAEISLEEYVFFTTLERYLVDISACLEGS